MIDFRFHLISIVAVFLALGLGILMGSVVLDQQLVDQLKRDVDAFRRDKRGLQEEVIALERQLSSNVQFADAAEDWIVVGELDGREVVVIKFAGTDDRITDGLADAVEEAGGRTTTTITLADRFRLPGAPERDQLALIVESASARAEELRREAGSLLGSRLAAAAVAGGKEGRFDAADAAVEDLLAQLEDTDFVDVEGAAEGRPVPRGAHFVVVGGNVDPRPFKLTGMALTLTQAFADRGAAVVVAESSDSSWALVSGLRSSEIEPEVSSVDHAESIAGRIAMVLALRDSGSGENGHYGTGDGADEVIPKPSPAD